jgi:hypothetical protein
MFMHLISCQLGTDIGNKKMIYLGLLISMLKYTKIIKIDNFVCAFFP